MIELNDNALEFSFTHVHPSARLSIDFQRTLRIPDDNRDYPLPPGLGRFALRHVDDFARALPAKWIERGGVMLPMHQSEAMWIHFDAEFDDERSTSYPFAIKIAAGKVNAVTGQSWTTGLHRSPQDYVVAPRQPWLDGFCVKKGTIRQFVAMPLGQGYTAEEQISDTAETGGVQIVVCPMKRSAYERRFPKVQNRVMRFATLEMPFARAVRESAPAAMGLGAGGRMKQDIYDDPYSANDWDESEGARCFIHLLNSQLWRSITGEPVPAEPVSAKDYTAHKLPWFDYYSENSSAVNGSAILDGIKSISKLWNEKNSSALPDNDMLEPAKVVELRRGLAKDQVREGDF